MAETNLTAREGFTYRGAAHKPGDVFSAAATDVDALTFGDAPLAAFDVPGATKADLQQEADRRGVSVKGTGADGNVLAEDIRAALG